LSALKRLVVNADDFGFTRDVNEGILAAHLGGIVTATTLMSTGAAFDHALELAATHPALDVGCHLVLVGGSSAVPPHEPLPASPLDLVRALALRRIRPYLELRAQLCKILDAGLSPSHLDTHKHTHVLPQVAEAVGRIAEEFHIRWVRRPLAVPLLGACPTWVLRRHGCRMTDRFAGLRLTGRLDTAALVDFLHRVRPGTTELMCHPGYLGTELLGAGTRLKESREREVRALVSAEARQAILGAGIRLVNYLSLGAQEP